MKSKVKKMKFSKRPQKEKYQVRFWSTEDVYKEFKRKCEREGYVVQDVFNEFMEQF